MGSVYLRGESWIIQYRDRGRIIRKSLGRRPLVTKTMAKEILHVTEKRLKLKQYDLVSGDIPTLNEFAPQYIEHVKEVKKLRSWSRYQYSLNVLKELYGDYLITDIGVQEIDSFKAYRLKKAEPATVNRELSTLRQLINLAKLWGNFYGDNPVSLSGLLPENNQVTRVLSYEEEDRLLEASNDNLRPIIITALLTGMRKSEIIKLKWSDVDFDSLVITIRQENTKTKKRRTVRINSGLLTVLRAQKLLTYQSGFVFLSQHKKPYASHDSLATAFNGACTRANIKDFTFHCLRHTCATRLVEAGNSLVVISAVLGHSDIKLSQRYSHPEDSLTEAMESIARRPYHLKTSSHISSHREGKKE
jgi:integrase